MLCPSCNNFRPANNAPCPMCQAPSPLVSNASAAGNSWGEQQSFASSGSWGGPAPSNNDWNAAPGQPAFPTSPWQDSSNAAQQLAFPTAAQNNNAFWSQASNTPGAQSPQQSLLPALYQGQPGPASQSLMVQQQAFPTFNPQFNPHLPALPDEEQEAPVYVAPMYTKPRPLIPRYRAISGLLSMIIVFAMLCGGAGYYAQTTGKLNFLEKMLGTYSPPAIVQAHNMLSVPSTQQTVDPAGNVVTGTSIGNNINQDTGYIANYVNQFKIGEKIWISCNLNTSKPGVITLKWYNDGNFYREIKSEQIDPKQKNGVSFSIIYAQATEGKVEIYWNDQLQRTLLFVVEPLAQ